MLEASLGQLQARNHPHAEAVAAALNRTGSTERRSGLLLSPTSPLRQKAVQAANASRGGAGAGVSCLGLQCTFQSKVDLLGGVRLASLASQTAGIVMRLIGECIKYHAMVQACLQTVQWPV